MVFKCNIRLELKHTGIPLQPRFGHSTCVVCNFLIIETCIIIFGGYDLDSHKNATL